MDVSSLVRFGQRHWFLAAFGAALGVAIASLSVLFASPQYAATMSIVLDYPELATSEGDPGLGVEDLQMELSHRKLRTIANTATTNTVIAPVGRQLGLDRSVTDLQAAVTARVVPNSLQIEIIATDTDPATAARLAGHVAVELSNQLAEREATKADPTSRVQPTPVGEPQLADHPVSPNPFWAAGLGLLFGGAVGIGAGFLRPRPNRTVRDAAELPDLTGAPNLAVLPTDPAREYGGGPIDIPRLIDSPAFEPFHRLRTSLQFVDGGRFPHRLAITSPRPGEGRTATVCHLALTLARTGHRVIVVECDVVRPRLTTTFGLQPGPDLLSVLAGRDEPEWALRPIGQLPLGVLPCARPSPSHADLLRSRAMALLLRELDRQADVILLDTPPLETHEDAAFLARLCDGAALVIRYGSTTTDRVESAAANLAQAEARLLGTVLTDAPRSVGASDDRPAHSSSGQPAPAGHSYPADWPPATGRGSLNRPAATQGRHGDRVAGVGGDPMPTVAGEPTRVEPPPARPGARRSHRRRR